MRYFAAPGRIKICGNHTDHQRGRVLAAAIDLEVTAAAESNGTNVIRIKNSNLGDVEIDIDDLSSREDEIGTPASIVRGVTSRFVTLGYHIGGFDAEITSTVLIGAGLSSSAAYEIVIGNILKGLFGSDVSKMELAKIGQYAENIYFGKPCGLMDQMASSYGGINVIDFKDLQNPNVTPIKASFDGYNICVINTGDSHADLTSDYEACTLEMKQIAKYFNKDHLRDVSEADFYSSIRQLRHLGDRATLRAYHFFTDNNRVLKQAEALQSGDMKAFLQLVIESGHSSLAYLQNVYSPKRQQDQSLTIALALSEMILSGTGAWRVHGGGFAGTILAFVPDCKKDEYFKKMSDVFKPENCHFLKINKNGGREVQRKGS